MKKIFRHLLCSALALALALSANITAHAAPVIGNGIILSDDVITLTEGTGTVIAAAMQEGFDASRLACVSADPNIASIVPVAAVSNVANFRIDYKGNGSTVIAVFYQDNPAVVAYAAVNSSTLIMQIPPRLGTNHDNYCSLTGYEFKPYDFNKYVNFGAYKSTLKLTYRVEAVGDEDYSAWGCYGRFYDAAGNVLSQVHLYCGAPAASAGQSLGSLSVGQVYTSEFSVPVNAVCFSIEGF